jgi:hypothetical protein
LKDQFEKFRNSQQDEESELKKASAIQKRRIRSLARPEKTIVAKQSFNLTKFYHSFVNSDPSTLFTGSTSSNMNTIKEETEERVKTGT